MSSRNLLLVLLAALLLVTASCGGSGDPSPEAYSDAVVVNRNRVDFVLARITRAKSQDELIARMDEAALLIGKAGDELDDKGAPADFQPEADDLVKSLRQLSVDVQATADQVRQPGFENLLQGTQGLNFESWDDVNKALAGLAGKGVQVSILRKH